MIPSTVTGVLVFLAAVGPGYVYVQIADRYRPRRERTALRETAEMVVSGALASLVGVILALIVGRVTHLLDLRRLASEPGQYLVVHAARTGIALLIVVLVSYGLAALIASWNPGKGPRVHSDSAWYGTFERDRPDEHGIIVTAELRDGRAVTGAIRSFTAEEIPVDERELTLAAPVDGDLYVRLPSGAEATMADRFIVLRGNEIVYLAGTYVPLRPSTTSIPALEPSAK